MNMKKALIFLFAIQIIVVVNATNYYISPAGNNANAGTSTISPWKTIQYALNQANDGDVLHVMAGTYTGKLTWNDGGVAGNYITLQNYNSDIVILEGSTIGNNQSLMYIENKNYIKIDGLKFTGHNGSYQPIINLYGICSNIEITNCEFYGTECDESYAILCEGSGDNILIQNNYLHDLMGFNAAGILFVGSNVVTPFTNITVSDNHLQTIEPAPSEGIALNGNISGFQISNNLLEDINNIGIVMIGGEDWVNTNDAVNFARNGVCKGNTVIDANSIYGGGYAAGVYVDGGKDIIVENNTITGSDVGLEIGCENQGFIAENINVRNNIIYKNEKAGLGFGGYDFPSTGMVQNCTFTGNTVFDNDILNIGFGQLWVQYALNCIVKNNIFYTSTNAWMVNAETTDLTFNNIYNYNLFYYPAGASMAKFFFDNNYIVGYANYISATGEDDESIFTDPLMVDIMAAIPDFHILPGSPCINAGDPTYDDADLDITDLDMDGESRVSDGVVDIGCDEHIIPPLIISTVITPVTCNGSCNGILTINGVDGCGSYTIDYKPSGMPWMLYTMPVTDICAGNYKVRITDACGTSITNNILVTEDPILNISVTGIVNETIAGASNGKITVNSSGGFGVKQYSKNGGLSWQSAKKFTGLSAGVYTILVKDAHNCTNSIIAEVGVGMRDGASSAFSIYPNPASDQFIIYVADEIMEKAVINIYSIAGELVVATELNLVEGSVSIAPTFSKGVYFVEIISGDFRSIQKLILE